MEHSILNIVFPKLLPCFFLNFTEYSPSPLAALKLTVTKMYEHHIIWENTCCYRAKETKMTKKKNLTILDLNSAALTIHTLTWS